MVRYLPMGNGRILINFDAEMNLMDFYFSRNQGENHAGHPFKFGVAVNNRFTWADSRINHDIDYLDHTMIGTWYLIHYHHKQIQKQFNRRLHREICGLLSQISQGSSSFKG